MCGYTDSVDPHRGFSPVGRWVGGNLKGITHVPKPNPNPPTLKTYSQLIRTPNLIPDIAWIRISNLTKLEVYSKG